LFLYFPTYSLLLAKGTSSYKHVETLFYLTNIASHFTSVHLVQAMSKVFWSPKKQFPKPSLNMSSNKIKVNFSKIEWVAPGTQHSETAVRSGLPALQVKHLE
jgi:hypothetical protein